MKNGKDARNGRRIVEEVDRRGKNWQQTAKVWDEVLERDAAPYDGIHGIPPGLTAEDESQFRDIRRWLLRKSDDCEAVTPAHAIAWIEATNSGKRPDVPERYREAIDYLAALWIAARETVSLTKRKAALAKAVKLAAIEKKQRKARRRAAMKAAILNVLAEKIKAKHWSANQFKQHFDLTDKPTKWGFGPENGGRSERTFEDELGAVLAEIRRESS